MNHRTSTLLCALLVLLTFSAFAADKSLLKPPPGAKVAIIEFEDLQCPDCARAAPLVHEAANTYKIPLVRHDFPLPNHNWSSQAAIIARYFDTKSKKVGDGWRDYCFQHQPEITPDNLRQKAEEYAKANKVELPFVVDPTGKLEALVKADFALGQRVGIEHTPTIYVVSNSTTGTPFIEVVDRSKLFAIIEQMKQEAGPDVKASVSPKKMTAAGAKKTAVK
jgi:protein-disulfide isomerase